ncbi:hypothetical protein TSAR_014089 [Trichomalopsis sarcophagae]|uniref:Uncharacterized protein n=1 Tax=Trichomalopsis sarcophagae TaxID=543379 RepID=A0A232FM92_9HYME|nr:hypothetical protein TSAR_014089 [Trichomalopsis sarcophagae]
MTVATVHSVIGGKGQAKEPCRVVGQTSISRNIERDRDRDELFRGRIAEGLSCYKCGQYNDGVGSITPCINYTATQLQECPKTSKHCISSKDTQE